MDVVRLDPSTHQPNLLIDGYDSMIFVERYYGFGEFELKTSRVVETMQALPFYSHISILSSREIMIVESHEVSKDEHGVTILTVSGRSYTNIFELRGLYLPVLGYNNPWPMQNLYTPTEGLAVFIWNLICNNTGYDVIHRSGRPVINFMPNMEVSMIGTRSETAQRWEIDEKKMGWAFVSDLLTIGALSLRTVRPIPEAETFQIVEVDRDGIISEVSTSTKTSRIEIYQGIDRSSEVILREDAGHFVSSRYLFSRRDYRNVAQVVHSVARELVFYPSPAENETQGFSRRVTSIDGGQAGSDVDNFRRLAIQQGTAELAKVRPVSLFDGKLSLDIPYTYGEDYELGDLLLTIAEYGLSTKMQVTEYIRSFDHTGETSYPTLMPVGIPVVLPDIDNCQYYPPPYAIGVPPGGYVDSGPFAIIIPQTTYVDITVTVVEPVEALLISIYNISGGLSPIYRSGIWSGSNWYAHFSYTSSLDSYSLFVTELGSAVCRLYPEDFYNNWYGGNYCSIDPPGAFPDYEAFTAYVRIEESATTVWLHVEQHSPRLATWNGDTWEADFPALTTLSSGYFQIMATDSSTPPTYETVAYTLTYVRTCPDGVDTLPNVLTLTSVRVCPSYVC